MADTKSCLTPITLGIHVHKYYLHWALGSVNITYIGLFGSLGLCTHSYLTSRVVVFLYIRVVQDDSITRTYMVGPLKKGSKLLEPHM